MVIRFNVSVSQYDHINNTLVQAKIVTAEAALVTIYPRTIIYLVRLKLLTLDRIRYKQINIQ